ncbi:restriction endonuclease subunit S [Staphylococcus saprophyticus]|uniref:restriction endonuclease subunit S n=1 Tax=Staphylococcus saprophyticus TaxID=29385 RepID=UPI00280B4AE0|nr:restriction endonuclease subunit S [Staphylococcus saprophyticus]MEB5647486.1 restriction endonuclease subunit S [Staphylococcus saprophyticus]WMM15325.1 restriction endonuclease subunit S [Staphylococcus saprophyticus]
MEYKLGKVSTFYDSLHKTPKNYNIYGYPMVRVKDISTGFLDLSSCFNVSEDDYLEFSKKYKPQSGDIIITRVGTYGNIALVTNDKRFCLGQNTVILNVDKKIIDNKYLFYYLTSSMGQQQIESKVTGSTQKTISLKSLKEINIIRHDYYKEKQIGNLLYKIDNKINNNKQIIANLEELSQTLFKRWFVDFEFPDENGNPYKSNGGEMVDSELGAIPKGWNVKNLDDIANYMNGLAMQKFKPTDNQNSLPVVKIKELKNGSTDENSNRCTSEIPEKALIVDGDIIFSWSATLLVKMWCGGKAGLNQHLFKVSSDKYPKWFYYYWTKRYIDYFIGIANDKATTMGHINRKHLSHAKILTPNDQTLEKFSRTFDDLLEKELSVSKESKRLTELRDTLLPKLMSGEIEIPTDIEVNEDELSI